jgi:hypothetical protein
MIMKKIALVIGGVVVVVGVTVGVVVGMHSSKKTNGASASTSSTSSSGTFKVVAACNAFTLADAEAVLGVGTKAGSGNGVGDASSGDINVSTCSYLGANATTATVLARSAKTDAGASSNMAMFGPSKPVGKQDVSGIGDKAFWDAALSQLDVLKGSNWYIIGNMTGTHADSGTLATSEAIYNQIKNKL